MYQRSKLAYLDIYFSLIFFAILTILFHETTLDEKIAHLFYSPTLSWTYRDNFLLEKILHKGGVIFIILALVTLVSYVFYLHNFTNNKVLKNYIGFILLSSTLTIMTVFFLKKWTTLPCPWHTYGFVEAGTIRPSLWNLFSFQLPNAHCFPGGHSSGGYAFLSAYFGNSFIYGKRNFKTLIPGVLLGIIFGVTQQARGAHFMSHDMATIVVSIFCSLVTIWLYSYYYKSHEV